MTVYRRQTVTALAALITLVLSCADEKKAFRGSKSGITQTKQTTGQDAERNSGDDLIPLMEQEFRLLVTKDESIEANVDQSTTTQSLTLVRNYQTNQSSLTQTSRPIYQETINQGWTGDSQEETFNQIQAGIADVLIVVDGTGSMGAEQNLVVNGLQDLLSEISNTSWRIGVVSMDAGDNAEDLQLNPLGSLASAPGKGCLRELINKNDPDYQSKFSSAIGIGTPSGIYGHEGFRMAVAGLDCTPGGTSWLRKHSFAAVILVSDADNCVNGRGTCLNKPWAEVSYFEDYVSNQTNRTIGTNLRVYGLINPPANECDPTKTQHVSTRYQQLVDRTGGQSGQICAASYQSTLRAISTDIKNALKAQFQLGGLPATNSVRIAMQPQGSTSFTPVPTDHYTIKDDTIEFLQGFSPPQGSQIRIRYTDPAQPVLTEFPLSGNIDPTTMAVTKTIGSTTTDISSSAQYIAAANGQPAKLRFPSAPDERSELRFSGRQGTLPKSFPLNCAAAPASIKVSVNGTATQQFTSSTSNDGITSVVFNQAPADAQAISVDYDCIGGKILRYPLPSLANAINYKVFVKNSDVTETVATTYEDGHLTFADSLFSEGLQLEIQANFHASATLSLALPFEALAGSLQAKDARGQTCSLADGGLLVDGGSVTLSEACYAKFQDKFKLTYRRAAEFNRSFRLDGLDHPQQGTFRVWVDDEELTEFFNDDGVITIPDSFDMSGKQEAKVRIRWERK